MKAYKAFNKDMTCRGFQFEEGKEYYEDKAELCKSGFHACLNPLDCWTYYDMFDSEIHEVELDEVSSERGENTKVCGKKIKIGAKLSLMNIISASIDFVKESIKSNINVNDDNSAQLASPVDCAKLASSGDFAKLASYRAFAKLASSGRLAQLVSSDNYAQLASSGQCAKLASSGPWAQLASSGDHSQLASSGDRSQLASSGDGAKIASYGDFSKLASSGNHTTVRSTGENSVIVCSGYDNKVSAVKGSWITLTEWKRNEGGTFIPVCVKTEQVDGVRIKENVLYTIKDGKFVEVEED